MGRRQNVPAANQRAAAPELGALGAVQENGGQPGPLAVGRLDAADDATGRVLLLAALVRIDDVVVDLVERRHRRGTRQQRWSLGGGGRSGGGGRWTLLRHQN